MNSLGGIKMVTTCGKQKADKMFSLFTEKGASVSNYPLITIEPNKNNSQAIKEKLSKLSLFDWVVFTSTNGAQYYDYWLKEFDIDPSELPLKYAAIGSATAALLINLGYAVKYISNCKDSSEYGNELVQNILGTSQKVLVPTSNLANNNLKKILNQSQECEYLVVYNTKEETSFDNDLNKIIETEDYDMFVFLSPSAVESFVSQINGSKIEKIKTAAIGNTTSAALKKVGINPLVTASQPTIPNLVNDIEKYFNNKI